MLVVEPKRLCFDEDRLCGHGLLPREDRDEESRRATLVPEVHDLTQEPPAKVSSEKDPDDVFQSVTCSVVMVRGMVINSRLTCYSFFPILSMGMGEYSLLKQKILHENRNRGGQVFSRHFWFLAMLLSVR